MQKNLFIQRYNKCRAQNWLENWESNLDRSFSLSRPEDGFNENETSLLILCILNEAQNKTL